MSFVAIVAILTALLSIAVKVVGMPDQIRNNFRRKSTEGLSSWFLICTLISYALWVVHGLQVNDMSLVIGQGLGVFVTAIIVWQMVIYRKPKDEATPAKPMVLWYAAWLDRPARLTKGRVPAKRSK
jgi:uncharacterized protein with PQ loop repeat